jgi:TolB-like protein/DNA-binding winged helix-turn-helix (wHTH) protein
MELPTQTLLRIGDWRVNPTAGQISRNGETARVEVRTMRLLLCLAEHAGEVVSIEELLNQVWSDVAVTPDSVYQAVTSLRRLLGDDPKQPNYIVTVPRLGYRMIAAVGPWVDEDKPGAAATGARGRVAWRWAAGLLIGLALMRAVAWQFESRGAGKNAAAVVLVPQGSIAVLPFLDLTEGMKEEEFADGMTEELIGKLSKIPGLRVPAPTASFYFKAKQIPVAEIAKALGVAYVLDGSVRKSGGRLRVAARLVRADSGYVVWTETYDRPFDDVLMVQDDIAGEVTKALKSSLTAKPVR